MTSDPDNVIDSPDDDGDAAPALETMDVPADAAGMRLDTWLGRRQVLHSRTFFQQLIKDGRVLVNGAAVKPRHELAGGEHVEVRFPPPEDPWPHPQDIPVELLYSDNDIIVVNKAPGMVVHPAAGNPDGTLVNALLFRFPDLPGINGVKRPGLVHRLDKDTSGVMVVAKTERAMKILSNQIRDRSMSRIYLALVIGDPEWSETTISAAIGRSGEMRVKRTVDGVAAKDAVTHLRVLARARGFALVRCQLETGRTHQIRVHCAHAKLPIAGDDMYGGTRDRAMEKLRNAPSALRTVFAHLNRPFLHARSLRLRHPLDGTWRLFEAPVPADLRAVLDVLMPGVEFPVEAAEGG